MRSQELLWKIRGSKWLQGYANKWGMISEHAEKKLKILTFWDRHGLAATEEAFGVRRRSLPQI